jgi:hypothetical protein
MTKEVTIQGAIFNVSQPFAAGHTLTEIEAKVLNQTRTENVRNNVAKRIKELLEAGNNDDAAKVVAEYDAEYEFTSPREGGSAKMDPLEKEALKIAKEALRAKIKAAGRKVAEDDVTKEQFEEAAAKIAEQEDVIKAAKKRLSDQAKIVDMASVEL